MLLVVALLALLAFSGVPLAGKILGFVILLAMLFALGGGGSTSVTSLYGDSTTPAPAPCKSKK